MTLASAIIRRGFREGNLLAVGGTLTTAEETEALDLLNTLVLSTVGLEVGRELRSVQIGGTYDESSCLTQWVPPDTLLALSLAAAQSFTLDPIPCDGQRLALTDALGNLATYNATLNANGRKIEAVTSLALSTNGDNRQWMYRADTGNWVRITSLATSDEMPFPAEFDDYFTIMLAMRLSPRNSQGLAAEHGASLVRARSLISARYRRPRPVQDMGSYGLSTDHRTGYTSDPSAWRGW